MAVSGQAISAVLWAALCHITLLPQHELSSLGTAAASPRYRGAPARRPTQSAQTPAERSCSAQSSRRTAGRGRGETGTEPPPAPVTALVHRPRHSSGSASPFPGTALAQHRPPLPPAVPPLLPAARARHGGAHGVGPHVWDSLWGSAAATMKSKPSAHKSGNTHRVSARPDAATGRGKGAQPSAVLVQWSCTPAGRHRGWRREGGRRGRVCSALRGSRPRLRGRSAACGRSRHSVSRVIVSDKQQAHHQCPRVGN